MTSLVRPTLVRRVILALLIAFSIVWLVLIAFQYAEVRWREGANPALAQTATQLADILSTVDSASEASIIAAAIDRSIATTRQRQHIPGRVLMQIRQRTDEHVVFSSPGIATVSLSGDPARQTTQLLDGEPYHVVEFDAPRWSILVAQSRIESFWLLRSLGGDLTKYMLIAFPFLLLPMWLAVAQGLRPLQRLSERIATRSPEDLAPIGTEPKYAELKPLVFALDALLERLNQKIQSEQAFVANAAHELRTPLALISAQAHVLAKAADEQERTEAEHRMIAAIARASHLVHQLLVLARIEMKSLPESGGTDVAQLVRQEIANFVPEAMERNIDISMEAPERLKLALDVHAFQSIVQNLIDNAVRYIDDGGHILVALDLISLGRPTLMLSVSDDGPGIPAGDRRRVFDRFYRVLRQDARGAGLGLTIVQQAATRLGGLVRLTDGPSGRGCRFEIHIPAS